MRTFIAPKHGAHRRLFAHGVPADDAQGLHDVARIHRGIVRIEAILGGAGGRAQGRREGHGLGGRDSA